jgi:hypothetical protein
MPRCNQHRRKGIDGGRGLCHRDTPWTRGTRIELHAHFERGLERDRLAAPALVADIGGEMLERLYEPFPHSRELVAKVEQTGVLPPRSPRLVLRFLPPAAAARTCWPPESGGSRER